MKVYPVSYKNFSKMPENKKAKSSLPQIYPQINNISNYFYAPAFKGLWLEKNIIKKVEGKQYQGLGLFTEDDCIDFSKVGTKFLNQEPLDISSASDNEVYAYWHANALRETYETTWVRRFNQHNMTKPLAVFHTLNSQKAKKHFAINLTELFNTKLYGSLDIPITDKEGNLSINCTVFDTETTGTNIEDVSRPLDKIIQIGSIQVKKGKVLDKTAYSKLINPEMPIPSAASDVHGITDEDVKNMPTMEQVLKDFLTNHLNKQNGIIVAYNSKFDLTLLNNAIKEHNTYSHEDFKLKQSFKVLDPFILIQRIHPYLGVRKKLSEQYQFLFAKNMENAHDAFADVKGTVDILKYCLYYLEKNRKDKFKPLTLREVLIFQNGGKVENIAIPLDLEGCNSRVNFAKSYTHVPLSVDNYFKGYKLTSSKLKELAPLIGYENVQKLKENDVVNQECTLTPKDGYEIHPAETKRLPKKAGVENSFYVMKKNFLKVLGFAELEPFGDLSKEQIEEIILNNSKLYVHNDIVDVWMKNTNPLDIKDGNDLPDLEIARKVISENK